MDRRPELHELLCEILGSRHVYYQTPESLKMEYPAIVYSRNDIVNRNADNLHFTQLYSYQVIVIDENPDSPIVFKIAALPKCRFTRHYVSDNLNHDVFKLYY